MAYRSMLGFRRDRANFVLAFVQPLVLSFIIVFSQHAHSDSVFIQFFLVISALWLGMTLTVREAVRERKLYVRDRIASLSPDAYIAGKLIYSLALCFVQSMILVVTSRILVSVMIPRDYDAHHILESSWMLALAVLTVCSFGGAIIGLTLSVVASSERTAVAMLPLAILPQMLLSRVSFGDGSERWMTNSRFSPFGPVIDMRRYFHSNDRTFLGGLESILSLPLLSRPGTAVLDLPIAAHVTGTILAVEWLYYALLLLAYLLALYVLFQTHEPKWQQTLR